MEELQTKTKEFLQPNPTARAKMAAVKGISKLSGQAKSNTYPQPEGVLGDCMLLYGKKLGEDTVFCKCHQTSINSCEFYEDGEPNFVIQMDTVCGDAHPGVSWA